MRHGLSRLRDIEIGTNIPAKMWVIESQAGRLTNMIMARRLDPPILWKQHGRVPALGDLFAVMTGELLRTVLITFHRRRCDSIVRVTSSPTLGRPVPRGALANRQTLNSRLRTYVSRPPYVEPTKRKGT